jgi:hypothetical protein
LCEKKWFGVCVVECHNHFCSCLSTLSAQK